MKKAFKNKIITSSLIASIGFLGMTSYGMFRDKPLFYLLGISGFIGSIGSISSGIYGYHSERERIDNLKLEKNDIYNDGYSKGYDDCNEINHKKYQDLYSQTFNNGIEQGKRDTEEIIAHKYQLKLEVEREAIKENFESEKARIVADYQQELETLDCSKTAEIENLKEHHKNTIEALETRYKAEITELNGELEKWEKRKSDIESKESFLEMKFDEFHKWEISVAETKSDIEGVRNENFRLENTLAEYQMNHENIVRKLQSEAREMGEQQYSNWNKGNCK